MKIPSIRIKHEGNSRLELWIHCWHSSGWICKGFLASAEAKGILRASQGSRAVAGKVLPWIFPQEKSPSRPTGDPGAHEGIIRSRVNFKLLFSFSSVLDASPEDFLPN